MTYDCNASLGVLLFQMNKSFKTVSCYDFSKSFRLNIMVCKLVFSFSSLRRLQNNGLHKICSVSFLKMNLFATYIVIEKLLNCP